MEEEHDCWVETRRLISDAIDKKYFKLSLEGYDFNEAASIIEAEVIVLAEWLYASRT
jgi:hypothetical protein